jgi:enamine deaminase RidA (YjgF/YER057c/UK114 family)
VRSRRQFAQRPGQVVYLLDLAHFAKVNEIMASYQPAYPARAAVGVASLPRGAQVEIEGVMVLPDEPAHSGG